MRIRLPTILGMAAALLAATSRAQTTHPDAPAATAPATQMSDADRLEQQWATILKKLGSEEFKERESAQKEVEKATFRDLPALQALAEKQTGPEVRQRLLKRVDELQVQLAFEPPPIDFDVQDGTLRDVSDAITKIIGIEWKPWNGNGSGEGTFTLHVKEKPFWDVILALSAQHSLQVQSNGLMLITPGIVWGDRQGAFFFYPKTLSRIINLQKLPNGHAAGPAAPAAPPRNPRGRPAVGSGNALTFSYEVLADPRLKLASCSVPTVTSVVDDKGTVIYQDTVRNNGIMQPQGMLQYQPAISLPITEGLGRTITVKGEMTVSVIISQVSVEVPDMQKQGNKPIQIMDQEVVWDKFEPKNGIINFQMNMRKSGSPMQGNMKPVRITLVDAAGRQLISQPIQGSWGGGLPGSDALPIKAIFSIPTRTEERKIPFEFKDLPVP